MLPVGKMNNYLNVKPSDCKHNYFVDSFCTECGFECVDHDWNGGVCMTCGFECDHYDTDGYCCIECGLENHEFMDFDSLYESYKESKWED